MSQGQARFLEREQKFSGSSRDRNSAPENAKREADTFSVEGASLFGYIGDSPRAELKLSERMAYRSAAIKRREILLSVSYSIIA